MSDDNSKVNLDSSSQSYAPPAVPAAGPEVNAGGYTPPQSSYAPPPAPGYAPQGGYAQAAPNEEKAVMTLVLGLIGVLVFSPVGVAAIFVGRKSLNNLKAHPYLQGRPLALTGYILGWVSAAFLVLSIIFVVVYFFIILAAVGTAGYAGYSSYSGSY